MAFKRIAATHKYYKLADCKKGDPLVSEGEYIGTEDGKFGPQHIWKQKNGDTVCLSGGQLDYMVEKSRFGIGDLCNVIYDGTTMLTKGTFKGKEAHNFIVEIDEDYNKGPKKIEVTKVVADDGPDISL